MQNGITLEFKFFLFIPLTIYQALSHFSHKIQQVEVAHYLWNGKINDIVTLRPTLGISLS